MRRQKVRKFSAEPAQLARETQNRKETGFVQILFLLQLFIIVGPFFAKLLLDVKEKQRRAISVKHSPTSSIGGVFS